MSDIKISPKYIDYGERTAYDMFRINNPDIDCECLYSEGDSYYIYCPQIKDDLELQKLNEYIDDHRQIGSHISVRNFKPEGVVQIKERNLTEINTLTGANRTKYDLLNEIHLEVKSIIKNYKLIHNHLEVKLFITSSINEEEIAKLQDVSNRIFIRITISKVDSLDSIKEEDPGEPFLGGLILSRFNSNGFSERVKSIWEEDEDFWMENREKLFSESVDKTIFTPNQWNNKKSKCFIDCTVSPPPCKLINLLTLYDQVYVVAPIADSYDSFLKSFNVSNPELLELSNLSKLKFIFPQNLKRYPNFLLEGLSEINNTTLLSRRLAAISVSDLRMRNPLFFPNMSIQERQLAIRDLKSIVNKASKVELKLVDFLLFDISQRWYMYPEIIGSDGALGIRHFGLSRSISKTIRLDDMQTISLDLITQMVEWCGALDCHLIPNNHSKVSLEPAYKLVANIYTGMPDTNWVPKNFDYSNFAVSKILSVDSEIPIVDFVSSFNSPDINLFREFIHGLVYHKKSIDEVESSISGFNFLIKSYEDSKKSLNEWDISGFIIDLVTNPLNVVLSSWVINRLGYLIEKYSPKNSSLQKYLDQIESMKTGASLPSAVLVSRMRNQLADTWKTQKFK